MVEKLIYRFVEDLGKYNNYNNDQIEQAKYALKILVYEIIKFSLIIFIFSLLGYFKESLLIIFIMSITKPFIGGYHEDTQIKCFIATLIVVAIIIVLFETNKLNLIGCIILNLVSIFSIYNKAPIIDNRMPITREDLIKKNRKIGIINSLALILVSIIIFKVTWASQIIVWTILVQAILMFNKYQGKPI
ncbi:accessory gene regulator B superfamily protein [Clostridium sartagoforme AAU1]|uniref:Accessory gene regulator B superfamily protein n=1 Tax=Clostridium sartagoforme AAU1 TaxID=1202534 RepID=R9BSQ0_9CLOT|nr:accessory gene regulator B family protein [Clostridium sartagoforme]EOR20037.1 accessory gene regulator B superfamily protein [Clostridium sartagoforme AAU1]